MIKPRFRRSFFLYLVILIIFVFGFYISTSVLRISEGCQQQPKKQELRSKINSPSFSKQSEFFIVIIFSAPENYEKRRVIRRTWLLTKKNLSIRHFFVIGSASLNFKQINALNAEHFQFVDLILLDTVSDSFSKLSNKLLQTFQWLDSHMNFTFLLKVDDDSFVRLDALYAKIEQQPKEKLYWGFFDGQARVKSKGKWAESVWFLCDRYLPYAKGGGYILTQDLVSKIVLMSDLLFLYRNEDVALGTWLAPFDIQRLHDPLFDTEYLSRGCLNSYLVTHKQSTSMMVSKYNHIVKSGNICLSEYKSRPSYNYDWKVLPSHCCYRNDSKVP
ncbi:beta-1,3-galactosyltransferase 6-like [Parasteatoda tepidariorum]|uniref:beta-1,3-galactosyltransferase 6-like n=1 Tax=Parasteatoda tepidariorum TaxID=114398 RepID=UPI00077FC269|nr:beta-1,3-galactosyltransferase 6-like [Parasteatoda tepidariorum]XP_042905313.1 beta-1,3-galactosyltransferase 6-like [Parasteatoda tepidariorum]